MNKEDFFTTSQETRDVEMGGDRKVKVRKLSQAEVKQLMANYLKDDKKQADAFVYVMCKTVVNADGTRVFEDCEQDKLAGGDFERVKIIASAALEFSGLGERSKNG